MASRVTALAARAFVLRTPTPGGGNMRERIAGRTVTPANDVPKGMGWSHENQRHTASAAYPNTHTNEIPRDFFLCAADITGGFRRTLGLFRLHSGAI